MKISKKSLVLMISICWFGWCNEGPKISGPEINDSSNPGMKGGCVTYQQQEFRIFGIKFGERTVETYGNCEGAY